MLTTNLTQLESSGLIRLAQNIPQVEYLFRHALLQEAAYDSILKADRRMLHLAVGEEIEQLFQNRLDEFSALLGHHFREAGRKDKARAYFSRAADYAFAKFANHEAELDLRAALELSPSEQERANLSQRLGVTLVVLGRLEEARGFFDQALPIYLEQKDFDNVAAIYGMFAQIAWGLNNMQALLDVSLKGLNVVGDAPPSKGLADLLRWASAACVFNDKLDEATVIIYKALDVSKKANAQNALAHSLTTLGLIQDRLGQPEQAVASYHQAIELAEKYSLSNPNARARNNLANILLVMGRIDEAAAQYEYMVNLCQKENTIFVKIWFLSQLGLLYIEMGKTHQAAEMLVQLENDMGAMGGHTYREQYLEFLGMLRYYVGELDQAEETLTALYETTTSRQTILAITMEKAMLMQTRGAYAEAAALIEKGIESSGIWITAEHWYVLAAARALAGDAAAARQALEHADNMIDAQPNFMQSLERLQAEINLDLLEDRYFVAIEKYREVTTLYQESQYRWRYARVLQEWACAALKANQPDTARDLLQKACAEFVYMEIPSAVAQIRQQLLEIDASHP